VQPKLSMRVLLEGVGLGEQFQFFSQAGFSMMDESLHLSDHDVDDMITMVEKKSQHAFPKNIKSALWKAIRMQWSKGPGHDMPFVLASEIPGLFLPKRDGRQMDSDAPLKLLDPDRQRQILRKVIPNRAEGGVHTLQFEIYRRQKDIFYELKDLQRSVQDWMKSNPRLMIREDPREEAMRLRVRIMMDAASGFLVNRKAQRASRRRMNIFFLLCRLVFLFLALLMYIVGWNRYADTPAQALRVKFWLGSGQFRAGTAFFLTFWVAFLVADRTREDHMSKRFRTIIIQAERLLEEISSFRVESDSLRMEEHEAVRQMVSAQITADQSRARKQQAHADGKPKRRKKKKAIDKDLAGWAGNMAADNMAELRLRIEKGIEDSFKRLPPLPDDFRRNGGDRMWTFEEKGALGGIEERVDTMHIKAPFQMIRGEARPDHIEIMAPEVRALPPPRRPPLPARLQQLGQLPPLPALRSSARGDTPDTTPLRHGSHSVRSGSMLSMRSTMTPPLPPEVSDTMPPSVDPRTSINSASAAASAFEQGWLERPQSSDSAAFPQPHWPPSDSFPPAAASAAAAARDEPPPAEAREILRRLSQASSSGEGFMPPPQPPGAAPPDRGDGGGEGSGAPEPD